MPPDLSSGGSGGSRGRRGQEWGGLLGHGTQVGGEGGSGTIQSTWHVADEPEKFELCSLSADAYWTPLGTGAERVAGGGACAPGRALVGRDGQTGQLTESALDVEPRDERGREGRARPSSELPAPRTGPVMLFLTQTAGSWSLQKSPVGLIPPLGVAPCCGAPLEAYQPLSALGLV